MSTRLQIAAVVYLMVQGLLFGFGVIAILATPLTVHAPILIPVLIVATGLVSLPVSWFIAPRLRLRHRARGAAPRP